MGTPKTPKALKTLEIPETRCRFPPVNAVCRCLPLRIDVCRCLLLPRTPEPPKTPKTLKTFKTPKTPNTLKALETPETQETHCRCPPLNDVCRCLPLWIGVCRCL